MFEGADMTGSRLDINGFVLDGGWTDQQLIDALQGSGIANIEYS
jgi:hypothetical protein